MSDQETARIDPADAAQYAGMKIMVVDDNVQNVELLEAYLSALPCDVSRAADGQQALERVTAEMPDLILLDVMMPKMSGFEVCQRLKSDPATREIPILMVTALNDVGDVERGNEAGTDDFLSKPFNKAELLQRVQSLLRIRLLKRELERQQGELDRERRSDLDEQTSPG